MALVLADRVKETTTTTGTGTVTLLGASTGFQSFAVVGDTNTTYYTIAAQTVTEWEVGIGTYTLSGTTLSRTTVLSSSNSGSPVNFSAGTKDVFVTYPSSRSIYADGTTLKATNSSILPVISGGTGVTTSTGTTNVVLSNSPTLVTPALGAATATSIVSSGTAASSFTVTSGSAVPLTITNVGSGNSFVVEDSANPDATAFLVGASGEVGIRTYAAAIPSNIALMVNGDDGNSRVVFQRSDTGTGGAQLFMRKARGSLAVPTVVASGDTVGKFSFNAFDGTNYTESANIFAEVDGTPGVNDMPGRLVFSTTADGGSSPTERYRIAQDGKHTTTGYVQVDNSTANAAFTITNTGAGNSFVVEDSASTDASPFLIGNSGNVAMGTVSPAAGVSFQNSKSPTGAVNAYGFLLQADILSDVTTVFRGYASIKGTVASAFTLANLQHFYASQLTVGAGSTITNQYGFLVESTLTGATNNYGVFSNIASGTNRFNFYANGTAANLFAGVSQFAAGTAALPGITQISDLNTGIYFPAADTLGFTTGGTERMRIDSAGNVGIGGTASAFSKLHLSGTFPSSSTLSLVNFTGGTIPSTTTTAQIYRTTISTEATVFTTSIIHFYASQGTIGAGSTVNEQTGYLADSGLTGATTNIGFRSNIAAAANRFNFYAGGTADNYFAGVSQFAAGTAALPGITQISDLNTGIYFPAADTLGFTTGGSERVRIDSAGNVGIGGTASAGQNLYLVKTITGSINSAAVRQQGVVQSDVTNSVFAFDNVSLTAAAAFTLASYVHYHAQQATIGVGSTITTQYGFLLSSTLTGATNNYGVYSNIASAANRYNFYAAGTADNYFAGNVGIGQTPPVNSHLAVRGTHVSSSGFAQAYYAAGSVDASTTTRAEGYLSGIGTIDAAFTCPSLSHFYAGQGTITGGSRTAVTSQFGHITDSTLTGATNNYGFYSAIAAAANSFNFYAQGTAANLFAGVTQFAAGTAALPGITQISDLNTGIYFPAADTLGFTTGGTEQMRIDSAGAVGIGSTSITGYSLRVNKNITGSTTAYGTATTSPIISDVTSSVNLFASVANIQPTVFTLSVLRHYYTFQNTFSGGAVVTNQYGFATETNLTGATNNYGFYSNIASAANRYNFYANGTAINYFAGVVQTNAATAIPAGGTAGAGVTVSSTANFGVFFGSGAPTLTAAKGSLYLRSDGTTTTDRMYVNTNGSTTWTNVVTSA